MVVASGLEEVNSGDRTSVHLSVGKRLCWSSASCLGFRRAPRDAPPQNIFEPCFGLVTGPAFTRPLEIGLVRR